MKLTTPLVVSMILGLAVFGCRASGGDNDPSDACVDVCNRLDECDIDNFDDAECNELCDDIDREEDEISNQCEVAVTDLFECISDTSCSELEAIDLDELEDSIDAITMLVEGCEDEIKDVIDGCDDDFDLDDIDFPDLDDSSPTGPPVGPPSPPL